MVSNFFCINHQKIVLLSHKLKTIEKMKKLFTVVMGVVFVAALTSCKKNYTCTCTYDDGAGTTGSASYTYKDTKKNAESNCDANEIAVGSTSWKCEIK